MENYKNARDLLKKHLFDKLICERFGWEIRVGDNKYIVDSALTLDEHEAKINTINEIIRHLIYELDTYLFHIEVNHHYPNIPTIFHLLQMSIEFDDTPIDPDEVYEVDEATIQRTPNKDDENVGYKATIDFFESKQEVWKAVEKIAKQYEKIAKQYCDEKKDNDVLQD